MIYNTEEEKLLCGEQYDTTSIKRELEEIQQFLEITISEQPEEVVARGNDLQVYMARTGYLVAKAKENLVDKRRDETMIIVDKIISESKLSASVQKALVEGVCREEQFILTWCERLNATCTHQLDWCRTLISKAKEEMRLVGISREFK